MPLQKLSIKVIGAPPKPAHPAIGDEALWRLSLEQEKNTYPIRRITQLCLQCSDARIPLDSSILSSDQRVQEAESLWWDAWKKSRYYQGAVHRRSQRSRSEFHSATQAAGSQHDTPFKAINRSLTSSLAQMCWVWWDYKSQQLFLKYFSDSVTTATA